MSPLTLLGPDYQNRGNDATSVTYTESMTGLTSEAVWTVVCKGTLEESLLLLGVLNRP